MLLRCGDEFLYSAAQFGTFSFDPLEAGVMLLHGSSEFADGLDKLGHGYLKACQACSMLMYSSGKLQRFFRQDVSSEFFPQFRMLFNESS